MAFATFEKKREKDREATDADRHVGFIRVICGAIPRNRVPSQLFPPVAPSPYLSAWSATSADEISAAFMTAFDQTVAGMVRGRRTPATNEPHLSVSIRDHPWLPPRSCSGTPSAIGPTTRSETEAPAVPNLGSIPDLTAPPTLCPPCQLPSHILPAVAEPRRPTRAGLRPAGGAKNLVSPRRFPASAPPILQPPL